MSKLIIILGVLAVLFVTDSTCQWRIIHPTYQLPPQEPIIIRTAQEIGEPQWLYKGDDHPRTPASGDHPFLPSYIDDIKLDPNRIYARSLSTPRATRGGGTRQSSSRDTGPTNPGYNRRNARSLQRPSLIPSIPPHPSPFNPNPFNPSPFNPSPFNPSPFNPSPFNPNPFNPNSSPFFDPFLRPDRNFPFYARARRDVSQDLFASQEQLRTKKSQEQLASQEYFASQEQ